MDEELIRNYHRWREAEDSGRDDEADAAFTQVLRTGLDEHGVSVRFTARTMEAVAAAAAHDARRARRTRTALVAVGSVGVVAVAYFGGGLIASALSTTVVRLLDLLVSAVVGVVTGIQAGGDVWTVLRSLGRAATAFIGNPAVTVTILAIQGIAIAALLALQRLLGSDGESFR